MFIMNYRLQCNILEDSNLWNVKTTEWQIGKMVLPYLSVLSYQLTEQTKETGKQLSSIDGQAKYN